MEDNSGRRKIERAMSPPGARNRHMSRISRNAPKFRTPRNADWARRRHRPAAVDFGEVSPNALIDARPKPAVRRRSLSDSSHKRPRPTPKRNRAVDLRRLLEFRGVCRISSKTCPTWCGVAEDATPHWARLRSRRIFRRSRALPSNIKSVSAPPLGWFAPFTGFSRDISEFGAYEPYVFRGGVIYDPRILGRSENGGEKVRGCEMRGARKVRGERRRIRGGAKSGGEKSAVGENKCGGGGGGSTVWILIILHLWAPVLLVIVEFWTSWASGILDFWDSGLLDFWMYGILGLLDFL